MANKTIGNYCFEIGATSPMTNCLNRLAFRDPQTYGFVGMKEVEEFLKSQDSFYHATIFHHPYLNRLREEGCHNLYCANGRDVSCYDLLKDEWAAHDPITFDHEDQFFFGKANGMHDWFILQPETGARLIEMTFQKGDEEDVFYFGLFRGNLAPEARTHHLSLSEKASLLVCDFSRIEEFSIALQHFGKAPGIVWEDLEAVHGPIRAIAGIDRDALRNYSAIPLIERDTFIRTYADKLSLSVAGTDPHDCWSYLVPMRALSRKIKDLYVSPREQVRIS